ncbi:tripartite tricarboxylate transporter substrate binding protein [Bordetella petrii]|uniref:tripartite tricarboxylate transporter substrate binding protein n=1 Tax=Bordetella petrii TaxID=94624 RepID=UPI003732185A
MIRTLCLALCLFSAAACAAPFPSKPINLIVPYPPGGAVDPIARLYAEKISQNWGVPVIVLNRPGAGTTIGLNQAAKAEPDGYTVVLATASITSNAPLYRSLPYDTLKDFTYLSMAGMIPLAITANPRTPVNSLDELVDRLKRQPGSLTYSSSGNGTIIHLGGELFKSLAGVDMVHVPYKGSGPSVMAGVAGEVDLTFDSVFLINPQVQAGKLKYIAVASAKRLKSLPDVPAISEKYPGYFVTSWVGFMGPAGIPQDIADAWAKEIARVAALPDVSDRLASLGVESVSSTPREFAAFVESEIRKWEKVVRDARIPPVQ